MTSEELLELIAHGESQSLEFKETLRYDIQTEGVNRDLTKPISKTLAGFLNTHGGTLLIGVTDAGEIVGIARDVQTLSRQTLDGFELLLRNVVSNSLGVSIGPSLLLAFAEVDERVVAAVTCPRHGEPVYLRDGERQDFFIRDGNQTRPLDVKAAHEYIRGRWPPELADTTETIREVIIQTLREEFGDALGLSASHGSDDESTARIDLGPNALSQPESTAEAQALVREAVSAAGTSTPVAPPGSEPTPVWMRVATRRVIDTFLKPLAGSRGWKRLYIISPWLSRFEDQASLSFDQFVDRLVSDEATAYVVTRPPEEDWHSEALEKLRQSGRVNLALVEDLHVKLFTALTLEGSFAMLGSANFTRQSLSNREIGILVTSYGEGKRVIAKLNREAAEIYRLPGRRLIHQASFSP